MQNKSADVCLLGYSGHGLVVAEAAIQLKLNLVAYAEEEIANFNPFKLEYWGSESSIEFKGWKQSVQFILGIGDNIVRKKVADFIFSKGYKCLQIQHPESSVSNYSTIGEGTFIARNATLNPFCRVGKNVIINTSASIDHECTIGDNSHIAPGAVLAGNVTVGNNVFIGANSVIKQGIKIADHSMVGAGAVVVKDISSHQTVIGNPARVKNG